MDSSPPPPPPHQSQSNNNDNYYSYNTSNWLGFSLNPNPPDLSLFHPYFPPHSPPPGNDFPREQDESGAAGDYGGTGSGPKLEDFLGGSGIYSGQDASAPAAFYGEDQSKRVEAVEAVHGLIMAVPAEYNNNNSNNIITSCDVISHSKRQALVVSETPPPSSLKKSGDSFGHRTSIYRGVTRHRWTGRYEAHLWDNSCKREGQSRKGRQVYLGGYDKEERAARAYDLAALKYWGPATTTNFPVSDYEKELEEMKHMTRQEFVASLRRKSSGFSRGASMYRGVTRHHQHGRWQARIGRVAGNKDLYLGTFSTQEEAAEAYDIAAIKFRGGNAVTNFDISRYDVKSIASCNLPVGGLSNKSSSSSKLTTSSSVSASVDTSNKHDVSSAGVVPYHFSSSSSTLSFALGPTEQAVCWPIQPGFSINHHHHEQQNPEFNVGVPGGSFFGYGDQQPVSANANSTTEVPFAGPMSSAMVGLEYGRAAKANLSALHTLIFGME